MSNVGNHFNDVSFLSFLRKGLEAVPGKNLKSNTRIEILPPHERVASPIGYGPYSGLTQYWQINGAPPTRETAVIDGILKITTASKAIRDASLSNWNRLSKKSFNSFTATLITGIGSGITGIVLAANGMLAVAGVVSVLAIALLIVSRKSYQAYGVALTKFLEWRCPIAEAGFIRRQAEVQGILYIFNKRFQAYFSPEELQERWAFSMNDIKYKKSMVNFNADFIERFLKLSPLSEACFYFAFPGATRDHPLYQCVEHYESLSRRYLQIDREFTRFVKQVEKREQKLLDDIAAKVRDADRLLQRHGRGHHHLSLHSLRRKIAEVKTRAQAKIAHVKEAARADIRQAQATKQNQVIAQFRQAVENLIDNYAAIERFMQQQAQLQQSYSQPPSYQPNQQPSASAPPPALIWDNLEQPLFQADVSASAPSLDDLDIVEEK